MGDGKSRPPKRCPYCDEPLEGTDLPRHLPCDAVPPTDRLANNTDDTDDT